MFDSSVTLHGFISAAHFHAKINVLINIHYNQKYCLVEGDMGDIYTNATAIMYGQSSCFFERGHVLCF